MAAQVVDKKVFTALPMLILRTVFYTTGIKTYVVAAMFRRKLIHRPVTATIVSASK
jgi:hypothetical protein